MKFAFTRKNKDTAEVKVLKINKSVTKVINMALKCNVLAKIDDKEIIQGIYEQSDEKIEKNHLLVHARNFGLEELMEFAILIAEEQRKEAAHTLLTIFSGEYIKNNNVLAELLASAFVIMHIKPPKDTPLDDALEMLTKAIKSDFD